METLYVVTVRRNLDWPNGNNFVSAIFSNIPMTWKGAVELSNDIKKAGIPSVDINTIEIIEAN